MSSFQGPTLEEKTGYYYGLSSCPELVAWSDFFHPIVEMWNDLTRPLLPDVLQALQEIDWISVDILQIEYDNTTSDNHVFERDNCVVVLFISVRPGSTPYSKGYDVVRACLAILQNY
jgi:hypothetical protein